MKTGRKRKVAGRRERFQRIKNRYEPVYKTPAFLKNTIGLYGVSESGIFQTEEGYSKIYFIDRFFERMPDICLKLQYLDVDYSFLINKREKGSIYLQISAQRKDMTDAQESFLKAEKELELAGVCVEQRLENYCSTLSALLRKECRIHSYLQEPVSWKPLVEMGEIKTLPNDMEDDAYGFWIMAVRKLLKPIEEVQLKEIINVETVASVYMESSFLDDTVLADGMRSDYLGLDGVLPRMKRRNPVLYDILRNEDIQSGTSHFQSVGIYFLCTDGKDTNSAKKELLETAEKAGVVLEELPLEDMPLRERKRSIAAFGMAGNRIGRYRCTLSSIGMEKSLRHLNGCEERKEKAYDIDAMRELFFKKEGENYESEDTEKYIQCIKA